MKCNLRQYTRILLQCIMITMMLISAFIGLIDDRSSYPDAALLMGFGD